MCCRRMHTHPHSVPRQQYGWMEPQGWWSIMHTYTPSSLHLFTFLFSILPLSSPLSFKAPSLFSVLLSPSALRRIVSHSIMLLLDSFSLSFYPHPLLFQSLSSLSFHFSPSFPAFLIGSLLIALTTHTHFLICLLMSASSPRLFNP